MESVMELLLAGLLIVLSTWIWKRRGLKQLSSTQHNSVQGALDQSLATPPAGCSVVLNADHGTSVTAPTLNSNNFYGPSVFNFSTNAADTDLMEADKLEKHSEASVLKQILETHKANLKKKIEYIFEGKIDVKNKTHLKKVYTQLFVTEGELKDVNSEHEILRIDKAFRMQKCQDTPINCNDIFSLPWKNEENKVVLTKGIAGIGKTVSVHKFILDWVEGEANQDIDCIFFLPFREINLIKSEEYSLHELLLEFHPELEELKETKMYEACKLGFVFDGLDESQLPLDFNSSNVRSIKKKATVDALITNLIKGNLLPSSVIWITSRPAAANKVPSQYVSLFTEVRGFTDKQKEEYFKKRIPDETKASKIISHIKTSRSLYIMCHIPVFCWMTATVLQAMLVENQGEDIPTTLTEMYIHFLLIQMNMKNQKYDQKVERDLTKLLESNRGVILKLAKLAFEQLKRENIMFYEDDLRECGIDVRGDSEYTGMCTEIFKQESILHEKKVYCFIHLSVQEFLAALHVFYCYLNKDKDELQFLLEGPLPEGFTFIVDSPKNVSLYYLLIKAVDKAWRSQRGYLDLFLRFLLGITLDSNQKLLKGLLAQTEDSKETVEKLIRYITKIQRKDISAEASINLLFCLLELKDRTLFKEIQTYLSSEETPEAELPLSVCSALVYILQMSEEILDEFNPKVYNTSNAGCRRLVPAVRCCRKAQFNSCGLTEQCCETVASALQLPNSPLRELDLSNNSQMNAGAKLLSEGLMSPQCKMEKMSLASCYFSKEQCEVIALAVNSASSPLRELDLSYNDLQDSGVKLLSDGLKTSDCKLEKLRLGWCKLSADSCKTLTSVFSSSSPLTELDLSNNDLQDSGVKFLSAGLENPNCKLEVLRLSGCLVTEKGCSHLASALISNPSFLRELDLSYNYPGQSGGKLLTGKLEGPQCRLQILNMDAGGECRIKSGPRKYACEVTLDSNTAHRNLRLSEGNRMATRVLELQGYKSNPERFHHSMYVLCRESLSDRCYCEAEFSEDLTGVALTYKGIERNGRGDDSTFGSNGMSWQLVCYGSRFTYFAFHNNGRTEIPASSFYSNRVGVYLDWPAGILSFYSVSLDTHALTHIHTFYSKFTEPLYVGFSFGNVDSVISLC
ncbi:NACHT, LRR and PYD domains-containing protein 3-like isoform X1 [Colossoma macropomum]|uniref:NACHT, LRR and PYD domains-containing protein 3-like isoform X1 n=2 Tax=Colossoma macropomum TaxID=42526 RepID=UPI0018654627|nr:NACHT, LRR and PYD domains-containing protein 3-like isoform X1 [Colossoma macropomum]XP_036439151.1 NACHT, LRR and PYD domains-containing protein 3-like isoform X1 [Colossoma macropomum]XP_036439152.1 NACHT, LRR and PYD domains-containing protein 3-like isoform X1 [Colossoma macropomum]